MRTVISNAQDKWTLQQCIEHAQNNNLDIKNQELNLDFFKINQDEKKYNFLPNLNSQIGASENFGRSLGYDNQYYDVNSFDSYISFSTSVPLYQGGNLRNERQKSAIEYLAAREELASSKDKLSMDITSGYLNILYNKERLKSAISQLDLSKNQLERIKIRYNAGEVSKDILLETQSQVANEEAQIQSKETNLK